MKGIYKVGMTRRDKLDQRVNELWGSTGVPCPFEIVYAKKSSDPYTLEQRVHKKLENYRVHKRREFFACSKYRIKCAIEGHPPGLAAMVALVCLCGLGGYHYATYERAANRPVEVQEFRRSSLSAVVANFLGKSSD